MFIFCLNTNACLLFFIRYDSTFSQENFEEKGYSVGAFKAFDYPGEENLNEMHEAQLTDKMFASDTKPKIIIMGLRRSGKSSIQKVVFHKMSPNETLFLESTNKIIKEGIFAKTTTFPLMC